MRHLLFRKLYYFGISKFPKEQQADIYDAVMRYAFSGEIVEVPDECKPLFSTIVESINNDVERYERKRKER